MQKQPELSTSSSFRGKLFSSLRLSLLDATCYSLMIGMGEAYLAAFVLALGYSPIVAGLITTVPVVVGSAIQLTFVWIYKYISSYRKWVIWCARIQALTLFALATLPFWAPQHLFFIYVMTSVYWACTFSAGPAWNAWMGALVPPRLRVQFFAQRTRRTQIFTYVGLFFAGITLHYAKKLNMLHHTFSTLLFGAGVARLASAHFISRQIEKPKAATEELMSTDVNFLKRRRDPKLFVIFAYLFVLQFGVYIAAPFFNPYMLTELHLDYSVYMFLSGTTFLSRILLYPFIQKFADRFGPLKMVWFGTVAVIFTPWLWTQSQNYFYLLTLQILSGVGWGMQELGIFLLLLDRFPSQDRSNVLTIVNFLNSLGMLFGSLLGSRIMTHLGVNIETYYLIFTISTICRLCTVFALPYLDEVPQHRRFAILWRIVGLRPNLGAIMRPILYVGRGKPGKRKSDSEELKE